MAVEVIMPKFGLTMHEGTIQRYFKAAGEAVSAGESLYEVETEKVLYEVEAPSAGTLAAALFPEGDTVECGVVVAVIAEPGEDVEAVRARYTDGARPSAGAGAKAPPADANASTKAADTAPPSADGGRRAASPVARKLAAELGVELARITGSGPGGRITREDVERAATAVAPVPAAEPPVRTAAMRGMRKTIADRMTQSLRDSAQLTITTEADVSAAVELRERLVRQFDCTYTDLLIQAVARALRRHPRMNSRLTEDAIVTMPQVNVGMAVALDEGLIVPVVTDADRKELREIAAATRDLGERARTGKLRLEDVSGGTFTITNLGTYGIDAFTPILNLGETGILGVGRIVEKPVIYRGEVARRSTMTLSLTFDHRIIDGAPAAQFLQTVVEIFNFGER
jgi:pyruvate dehydrogenase E2 component (dihydrolipoamide acetyltransferase)